MARLLEANWTNLLDDKLAELRHKLTIATSFVQQLKARPVTNAQVVGRRRPGSSLAPAAPPHFSTLAFQVSIFFHVLLDHAVNYNNS